MSLLHKESIIQYLHTLLYLRKLCILFETFAIHTSNTSEVYITDSGVQNNAN